MEKSEQERKRPNRLTPETLSFMDDAFLKVAFSKDDEPQRKAAQRILRDLLGRDDLEVIEIQSQKEQQKKEDLKAIRLDLMVKARDGQLIHIEVQNRKSPDQPKRRRYYRSLNQTQLLKSSDGYEDLPDYISIWINDFDEFKEGLPIYEIKKVYLGSDGTYRDYVDGEWEYSISAPILRKEDSRRGQTARDLSEADTKNIVAGELRILMEDVKKNRQEELRNMITYAQEKINEGIEIGKEIGFFEGQESNKRHQREKYRVNALNLIKEGDLQLDKVQKFYPELDQQDIDWIKASL